MMSRQNEIFGKLLRDTRLEKHLTQEDLAEKSGIHRNHISFMERGLRSPTLETLLQVCNALEVRASELIAQLEVKIKQD
jgi:transcriptional regulator with XRE-family HTH domain